MNVPIEDAVTVAYVDIVHALSELKEAWEVNYRGAPASAEDALNDAIEDLNNALAILLPHVRKSETYPRMTEHRHMAIGCWCG